MTTTAAIDEIEARLTQAFSALSDSVKASLRPGASAADIDAVEAAIGLTLPPIVRCAYLMHDGQRVGTDDMFEDQFRWIPVKSILVEWKTWKGLLDDGAFDNMNEGDIGDDVRMDWWNAKWIPLARSESGDCVCVDLDPGASGVVGQMIEVFHDDERRNVLATNFAALLHEQAF